MDDRLPVPEFLPTSPTAPQVADLALGVYRQLALSARRADDAARSAETLIQSHTRALDQTLAAVAAQRHELERLLDRIRPDLEAANAAEILRLIDLFTREWDATLRREQIDVRDLRGAPLTAELAAVIDVRAAVPDPSVREPAVRETITPLVLHRGRVIGVAVVITSVPVEPPSPEGQP